MFPMKLRYVTCVLLAVSTSPLLVANTLRAADDALLADNAEAAQNIVYGKELWLFGGGEPICSSVEPQYCEASSKVAAEQHFVATQAFREKSFLLTAAAIKALQALPGWPAATERKALVLAKLQQLLAATPEKRWPEAAWFTAFEPLDLTDDEQNLLDDWFEQRPTLADGSTARMQVYYPGVAPYVREMFEAFVASAKSRSNSAHVRNSKPKLVLLTASSNDPLQWVDYYLQLFTAAGADANWLPLEPAFTEISGQADAQMRQQQCAQLNQQRFIHNGQYNRNARYPELAAYQLQFCLAPEKMAAMLQNADAVFINGGDQSLTMRSLQFSSGTQAGEFTALGKLLQQKIAAGMPLAGSSAGTAVQSGRIMALPGKPAIPMLSGGRTSKALQFGAIADVPDSPLCQLHQRCTAQAGAGYLTYKPDGGLRSFSLGVADTHFREREREGRLSRLLLDTGTDFGFGVDEATVLRANFFAEDGADLQVMGQGGVWILDASKASAAKTSDPSALPALHWQTAGLVASRLLAGDTLRFQQGVQQAQLQCEKRLPGRQVDPDTYAPVDQRRWLAGTAAITACQRQDGRWRYLQLPLTLQVLPAAPDDL
jgi:cyanophycinase-like exopeptidase